MIRLSASNIAWDVCEDDAVAKVLRNAGIDQIDIAPGKYFPDPQLTLDAEIDRVRDRWNERGFTITGMQALLFGTSGLNLFSDAGGVMFDRLCQMARIGSRLGARTMTFGSPKQRDRTGIDDTSALRIAGDLFRRLGDVALQGGITVCLEPNPASYGCNFLTTTLETAEFIRALDHPAVRLQLDVGAMAMNRESPTECVAEFAPLIGHVHASEPGLATLGDGGALHGEAGAALRKRRPDLTVTIEMAASSSEPHCEAMKRAAKLARAAYVGADA